MKIYIIDNNEIDLMVSSKLLERSNAFLSISISVCQSSVKALLALRSKAIQPDAIILDWHMAELHAEDWLTYYISHMDHLIPVYILTASIDPKDRQRAEKFEVVQGFFTKPFSQPDIDYLLHTSSNMMNRRLIKSYGISSQTIHL